ncbi:hypothetical protein FKP32DRAFT_1595421 [Trametes sanguinea]|nr:hypothetical protein FKP32DRAFT_1595421 [Trametes sanguinea]
MRRQKRGSKKARDGMQPRTAATTRLPALPLDVLHAVLEHASKPALLACSVVSRTWREAAVPHLFASLEIARSAGSCADSSGEFLDAYPHLARYIRRLRLVHQNPRWLILPLDTYPVVDRGMLATLLTRLPCLEELYLRSLWISTVPPRLSDVSKNTGRLRKLTLADCGAEGKPTACADLRILLDLASAVPVDMLHIELLTVEREADNPVASPPIRLLDCHALRLELQAEQSLDPGWDMMFWICDDLSAAFAPCCLTSLDLGCRSLSHVENSLRKLGQFLAHACSRTMRHLAFPVIIESTLASNYTSEQADFWRVVNLYQLISIETFELALMVPTPGYMPRVPLGAVCVALFSVLPPVLREVTITLWGVKEACQVKSKEMLHLGVLDDALDARAPVLEKVRLAFRGQWYLVEFTTAAMKAMSKCKKRGILEIVQWDRRTRPM